MNLVTINKTTFFFLLGIFLSVGVAGITLLFYLTPLKYVNLIEPTIKDISPSSFYEKYQKNPENYIFIDVRPTEVYRKSHAEGSINIPLHTFYTERKYLPKRGQTIVLICSGGSASGVAYGYLEHYGFLNLRRIEGGIEGWEKSGLPVVVNLPDK